MIGLALCKHDGNKGLFLFQVPSYCGLNKGDRVIVETSHGEQEAVVKYTNTVSFEDDDFNMIVAASNATLPLKRVLKKVIYKDLKYDDEELALWGTDSGEKESEGKDVETERGQNGTM